jgi:predicted ATPase
MLWGREQQCALLDGLIADARGGRSRVLVVRGEPGIREDRFAGVCG